MKIMVISHSSVVGRYQGKLHALARLPQVNLSLIVPPSWNEGGHTVKAEVDRYSSFRTFVISAFRLNYGASYFYHPIIFKKSIAAIVPAVIYVEEEPWSVAAWQSVRAAQQIQAKVIFFTWENIWKRYKWISEKILAHVFYHAAGAVAGNRDAESNLIRRGFLKPIAVSAQYGMDVAVFHNQTAAIPELASMQKPIIGYAGRLENEKGIDILLQAAATIPGEWNLLIVGNGSIKEELISLAISLGIQYRVRFVPAVSHDEIAAYLKSMDILVLPSRTTSVWKEQFGRILVEAMACGVPVIGSDSGAIPEVIGDAGLIFREGDHKDLASQLCKLIQSEAARSQLGQRGKKRSYDIFSDDIIAQNLFDFFTKVLSDETDRKNLRSNEN